MKAAAVSPVRKSLMRTRLQSATPSKKAPTDEDEDEDVAPPAPSAGQKRKRAASTNAISLGGDITGQLADIIKPPSSSSSDVLTPYLKHMKKLASIIQQKDAEELYLFVKTTKPSTTPTTKGRRAKPALFSSSSDSDDNKKDKQSDSDSE